MPLKQLSRHFTLNELTRSALAQRHGIANVPGPEVVLNLARLATYVLEPVRRHFALPFSPSSGYRAPEVNRLAGSKASSQHVTGQAVDFEIPGLSNGDVARWIKANLTFDQLILEFHRVDDPGSGWLHCSYVEGRNRNMSLIFDGITYKEF